MGWDKESIYSLCCCKTNWVLTAAIVNVYMSLLRSRRVTHVTYEWEISAFCMHTFYFMSSRNSAHTYFFNVRCYDILVLFIRKFYFENSSRLEFNDLFWLAMDGSICLLHKSIPFVVWLKKFQFEIKFICNKGPK